jgi:hypothetical protein
MADRQIKVVGKHRKDCWAIKNRKNGTWPTEWGPIAYGAHGEPVRSTERRYGKRGRMFKYWLVFVCNCVGCPAQLHIEDKFILEAARKATGSTSTRNSK